MSPETWPGRSLVAAAIGAALMLAYAPGASAQGPVTTPASAAVRQGDLLFGAACAACHGVDGAGALPSQVGFEETLPDFTDCSFATREPDADWHAIVHDGGPARGFSQMMPAFGDVLSPEQIQSVLDHLRRFCGDPDWPPGELNLPRALFTEKAYPEDEAVILTALSAEGAGAVESKLVFEKRIGARSQLELSVPVGLRSPEPGENGGAWTGGVGDLAAGFKQVLLHSGSAGSIVSVVGELVVPIGDPDRGFASNTTKLEAFASYGQVLPWDTFVQLQGGAGTPIATHPATQDVFGRLALGKTFTQGSFGRAWTPMIEVLAEQELEEGATPALGVAPQLQVTLSARQHVMTNVGIYLPLDDPDPRQARLMVYLLWDWFDGGLQEGW